MDAFHRTRMGQDFYLGYVPRITKALEALAAETTKVVKEAAQPSLHPHIIDSWDTKEDPVIHLRNNHLPHDESWQQSLVLAKLKRGWNATQ